MSVELHIRVALVLSIVHIAGHLFSIKHTFGRLRKFPVHANKTSSKILLFTWLRLVGNLTEKPNWIHLLVSCPILPAYHHHPLTTITATTTFPMCPIPVHITECCLRSKHHSMNLITAIFGHIRHFWGENCRKQCSIHICRTTCLCHNIESSGRTLSNDAILTRSTVVPNIELLAIL